MIKLVLGRLDYQGISTGVTFRLGNTKALDGVPNAELNPLGKALINRVFMELGIECDATHMKTLGEVLTNCTTALPASVELTDNYDVGELRASLHSAPIPTIEPLSTIIGLALASTLKINVEFYSDLWPRLTDALAQLKALGIDIAIHSSVFDVSRVYVFDEIIRRFMWVQRVDEVREARFDHKVERINYEVRVIEPRQPTPYGIADPQEPKIDEEVINAVEVLVKDLGGVATLKSLTEMLRNQDVVLRAIMMGYMTYNPGDMTVRATGKALALIRQLSHNNVALEEGPGNKPSNEPG